MAKCSLDKCSFEGERFVMPAHAERHKNEFERIVGRRPTDYAEVRELFNERRDGGEVATLDDFRG